MKRIVIIGGGFAGINLANRLALKKEFSLILVDRNNYNFFPPLLYQVATAFLDPSNISYPFRKLLRRKNIAFRLGELLDICTAENKVVLSTGEVSYDYLVLATGAETNYFGMENIKGHALPMKNIDDALRLRNHILLQLEKATITTDPTERIKLLNIVIAGAGPTGVEIAGMLAELRKRIVHKDYPELTGKGYAGHIYLVDGIDATLKPMSIKSQQDSFNALEKMGVEIKLNLNVKDYVDGVVIFANGETISTRALIWAAGITASVFPGLPKNCYGRGKRLITDAFNKVAGTDNIFAIGDTSIQTTDKKFPNGHPQLAQVAIQQGKNLAYNLLAMAQGKELKPFAYFDKGTMAIIGRNKAVVDLSSNIHFKGLLAWLTWIFVHLLSLISYRNRITTLYNWMAAYFTEDQPLRMIIKPGEKDV